MRQYYYRADYWQFDKEGGCIEPGPGKCKFMFAMCKPVPFPTCADGKSGFCQEQLSEEGAGKWVSLGESTDNPFIYDGGKFEKSVNFAQLQKCSFQMLQFALLKYIWYIKTHVYAHAMIIDYN